MLPSAKKRWVSEEQWQDTSHLCCLALQSALMKTEQKPKQSLTNQIQIFQPYTVAVPWIWPGCQMKTASQFQNGINRELVSQDEPCGPQIPSYKLQLNSEHQSRAPQWGRKSQQWKQHPQRGPPVLTARSERLASYCVHPEASEAKWATFLKGIKLPLFSPLKIKLCSLKG